MKNKKGFTLVELLAVIVILAIILVISVPKITSVIDSARSGSLESTAKMVAAGAETWYQTQSVLGEVTSTPSCSDVAKINDSDYENCEIEFVDGRAYVTIIGIGKFDGMSICEGTKSSSTVTENCGVIAREYIEDLYNISANDNGLYKDPTIDENLRYTGSDPKNYVQYNNELWRIIGIFEVSNGSTTSNRIKLIRTESIGEYSWDSSASGVNSGQGVNNWVASDLNLLLNDYYYNGKDNQTCYNGQNNATVFCSFGSVALDSTANNLIDNIVWTLGGNGYTNPNTPPYGLPTGTQYTAERGTTVYTAGTPTTHTAKIGLLFPSDYGYASTDTNCRSDLRAGVTHNGTSYDYSGTKCKNSNWLHTGYNYWTISPSSGSSCSSFIVYGAGSVSNGSAYNALGVRPVLYLKSDVKIMRGTGSVGNPYQLST